MPDLTGRIVPERKHFDDFSLRLPLKNSEAGVDAWLLIGAINNQLTASIIGEIGSLSNYTLGHTVREMAQDLLNAHAFIHGELFEVDIIGIIHSRNDGSGSLDLYYQDNVHDVIVGRECRVQVQDIWTLMQSGAASYIRRALNDLRMALTHHRDTPFYCYRAVETIRHHIGHIYGLEDRNEQWNRTWEVLGKSRDEVKDIEALATALRHGEAKAYSGEEWRRIVSITWGIVEAYILFALHGMRANR